MYFNSLLFYLICYAIGSIQFGYLISILFNLKNPYTHGSTNTGATNMFRINGPYFGLLTYFFDFLKVFGVYLVLRNHLPIEHVFICMYCGVFGHIYPLLNTYKGGKGVASFSAILIAISLKFTIVMLVVWGALSYLTSAGVASVAMVVLSIIFLKQTIAKSILITFHLIVSAVIIMRHNSNLKDYIKQYQLT